MMNNEWEDELKELKDLLDSTSMIAEVKWGLPVYTYQNKNVVGIGGFKNYYALWFFSGSLMKDPSSVLINAQENKTKGLRQWRFKSGDILNHKMILRYVEEALSVVESGAKIKRSVALKMELPAVFEMAFQTSSLAREKFNEFSVSKQNEYIHYINEAKKEETKINRMMKILPSIEAGIGYFQHYKKVAEAYKISKA